jgi:hypothetical protein
LHLVRLLGGIGTPLFDFNSKYTDEYYTHCELPSKM